VARRSRDTGSIYRRKDGLYVAQYKGQYRYSKDEATARAKLRELLATAEQEQPENITVAAYLDKWLTYAQQNLKPPTVKRYREVIEIYVKPCLGSKKLHKVGALTVQEMYSDMLWRLSRQSPSTVSLVRPNRRTQCENYTYLR
jgi:integrase